jgi:Domain of unknown function (DUF222)
VVEHLRWVADPEGADAKAQRQQQRRGLWLSPTVDGMVGVDGWLAAEAGQTLLAALEPLARPADAADERSGCQRRADALTELARRQLEGGRLPKTGGVRPQLLVTVDLDSLLGQPPGLGGELGGVEPIGLEGCRRLACDGAVTRVLITRHPPTSTTPATAIMAATTTPPAIAAAATTAPATTASTTSASTRVPAAPTTSTATTAMVATAAIPTTPTRRQSPQPDRPAPGGDPAAAPNPGRRPHPTPGGRPRHPGRLARPTRRPDRPRPRLRGHRLRSLSISVRQVSQDIAEAAPWVDGLVDPHGLGQPGRVGGLPTNRSGWAA